MKIPVIIFLLVLSGRVFSQSGIITDSSTVPFSTDSVFTVTDINNSSSITMPSASITYNPGSNTDIDTVVVYQSKESVKFNLRNKIMNIQGDSKLDYKEQHINSEVLIIDFNSSTLISHGVKDSNNKIIGFPKMTDKGETFVGERITFNFKTQQGTITLGETEVSEGFYFGTKIKRVSKSESFIQDGKYTTCDAPHPHYYFGSPEMKIIEKDKIFLDPLVFYVEDMPIFMLPFGLYFPNKGGRQSGLMIPSFFFSANRGVVLQDLGVYLALSDYYDTQFNVDYFSKGGFTLKNSTRWKLLDVFDGNMNLEYGKTKYSPDDEYQTNYKIALRHNHTIDPQSRVVANISYMSANYPRNTEFKSFQSTLTQNITSNASYSKSFDNGSSISVSLNRDQNIIDSSYRQTLPRINFSLPQLQPLKSLVPAGTWLPDWVRDLSFSYSGSGNYYTEHVNKGNDVFEDNYKAAINHSPSLSISPKLGYININPYFNFKVNNYFRRLDKTYNSIDSSVVTDTANGFFTEYNYSAGVDFSTRLFGVLTPKLWGVNAVRHTFQPTIGYSYSPDLSSEDMNFYGYYYDEARNEEVKYSRYSADGGGIASSRKSQSIRYSILNNFEAKIAQGDTIPDKNSEFFRWTMNGSYDMTKDSLKFSDIAMQFKIPAISDINMNANANFTLYDEERLWSVTDSAYTGSRTRVNQYLLSSGKGLMRLTNLSLNFSTSISSEGGTPNPSPNQDEIQETQPDNSGSGLGDRFRQRYEYTEESVDLYGDHTPGFTPLSIPWNLSLGLTFQYSEPYQNQITRRINLSSSFSFKLTNTWSFRGSAQYDLYNMELLAPNFEITKDLHCWQLSFQWWPVGYNAGFYLRFAIKAPQLSDLKIEKRDSRLLR
ncbi:putative LPS assembly protein LptD [Bacteroidota bacterium]